MLALAGLGKGLRPAYRALFAFDAELRWIALSLREPMLTQVRLAWWRDSLTSLADVSGHPVLEALAQDWPAEPELLTGLVDGWEQFAIAEEGFADACRALAAHRAAALLACAAVSDTQTASLAEQAALCWTLVTLADHAPGDEEREAMLQSARSIRLLRLPAALRPLAVLAGLSVRAARRGGGALLGDRLSPLAALRLGIFGR